MLLGFFAFCFVLFVFYRKIKKKKKEEVVGFLQALRLVT